MSCYNYQIILKYERISKMNVLQSYNIDTDIIVDEIRFSNGLSTNMHIVNSEFKQFRIMYDNYMVCEILNYQLLNPKNGKFMIMSKDKKQRHGRSKTKMTKLFPKFGLDLEMELDSRSNYDDYNFYVYLRDNFNLHKRKNHTFDTLILQPSSKIFFISDSQFLVFSFKEHDIRNIGEKILTFRDAIIYGIVIEIDQLNKYKIKKQYDISKYIILNYNHIIEDFISHQIKMNLKTEENFYFIY